LRHNRTTDTFFSKTTPHRDMQSKKTHKGVVGKEPPGTWGNVGTQNRKNSREENKKPNFHERNVGFVK